MKQSPLRIVPAVEHPQDPSSAGEERELILSAQAGDTGAFRLLYESYKDRVYSLIRYTLKDDHASEDALQTVFVKVFKALPYFRHESRFHTWLYRVALNECRNRKRRRNLFVPLDDFKATLDEPDPGLLPDQLHVSRENARRVQEAVLALTPRLREVVILKYVEDLSYDEIASVLECSPGTVASRLHRALAALEKRLKPQDQVSA